MADVQSAPAPVKDVSDSSASAKGEQSWNGNAARDIWGKPPVLGQRTDATQANQQTDTSTPSNASSGANDQAVKQTDAASDQSVKSTGPKEATTNANDQSRNNNENDQSQPTLQSKDAPQLVAEVPQEAPTTSNAKQYSLPDGSIGTDEQANGRDNLKLGVADNQFRITPEQEQKVIGNAQSTFDADIDRQIAALPGAALQGIGDGLNSLAQMGVFVGGTVLNELQIVGDLGVTLADTAVAPSLAAGDLKLLGDDSNALAAKGTAVMDGIGKAWAPADKDLFDIGFTGDYSRLLTDPVNAAIQGYDKYSSQSAPDQVRQLTDATTQVVAPVAADGMIGAAGALRNSAVDGTIGATFKANMEQLLEKMKAAVGKFSDRADVAGTENTTESSQVKGIRYGESSEDLQKRINRAEELKELDPIKEPTEEWKSRVEELKAGLTEAQRNFLAKHNIPVVPERHVIDVPGCEGYENFMGATFRNRETKELKIHLAEMVWKNDEGKWIPNPDAEFSIEHEFGHAFNEVAKHDLISNEGWFKDSIKAEIASLGDDTLRTLDINLAAFQKGGKYAEQVRDEIFSDLYAHTTGLRSNNPYSRLVKDSFPETLGLMEMNPEILQ